MSSFLNIFSDEYERASVPPYTTVDPSVYSALAAALRDEDKSIREEAALALGILDGKPAVRDLQTALQDVEPSVRGAAATAIGKIGTTEDGKALIPVLADEKTDVRNRVLLALGVLRVREAGPALREMYEQHRKKDSGVKVLACLSRIGDPAQAELFRELVQDPNQETRRLAIEGLGPRRRLFDAPGVQEGLSKGEKRGAEARVQLCPHPARRPGVPRQHRALPALAHPRESLPQLHPRDGPHRSRGDLYPYLNDPEAKIRASLCRPSRPDRRSRRHTPPPAPHQRSEQGGRRPREPGRGAPEASGIGPVGSRAKEAVDAPTRLRRRGGALGGGGVQQGDRRRRLPPRSRRASRSL